MHTLVFYSPVCSEQHLVNPIMVSKIHSKTPRTLLYVVLTFAFAFLTFHLVIKPNIPSYCFSISFSDPQKYQKLLVQVLNQENEAKTKQEFSSIGPEKKNEPTEWLTTAVQQAPPPKFIYHNRPMYSDKPIIFIITATYLRPTQLPDMTRLANTLRLVPDVFWIVVEDANKKSRIIEDLLRRSQIPCIHLLGPKMGASLSRGASNK